MAGVQHSPPNTPKSKGSLGLTQTQSEPDINSAAKISDYVNVNRNKRPRQGDSPQGELEFGELEADKNNQDISCTLAEQTTLMASLLRDIAEVKSQNNQIKASNAQIRETNEEIMKSMSFMNSQFEDMKKEIGELRQDRRIQQNYIENLEKKILDLQHKSRSSAIEIRNIPQENSESFTSLMKTVCKIGNVVGLPIPESDIRDIYRLPGKSISPTAPRPVIAEFTKVQTKQEIISATRLFNKGKGKEEKLNTSLIGIQGKPQPFYIAEQLPATTKKLFYQAREFAKSKAYKYCWISNGNVFLRKQEGDKQIIIHSEKCLQDLGNTNI
ncbi:unnamed protein product [Spodoptera littoralis]|uniref:FP protein C-terminal domain-containing protein n=1 Tax=Spodoptera littoralis TaxID=7109 RepID=A0A9P0I395_SPOLI|nr:unnamed protein product [Spodoptera littoralis]CAH1638160.1 unnamed protein product [Spodoptera littoralis]